MSAPRLLAPTTISGGVPTAGAGTLNTIALWTPDGNTLGNSLLTQSGNIVTNASGAIRAAGTTQTSPAFTRHDTTTSGIYFPATNEIGFTISSQHAMFISSGRYVGIGTTSPAGRLDVVGVAASLGWAIRAQVNSANTSPALNAELGLNLKNTSATVGNYTSITNRDSSDNANTQINFINVNNSGSGAINFVTRDSAGGPAAERARIDSSGNFSIGSTTSAGYRARVLTAAGTGSAFGVRIDAGTNSTDYALRIADQATTSDYFAVRGDGNVGIGTASPGAILHTLGTGTTTGIFATTSANAWVELRRSTSTTLGYIGTGAGLVTGGAAADLAFRCESGNLLFSTGATERARIDSSGNLGIGTVSPGARLHVSDNSSIPVIVQSSGSTDSYLRFINTSNNLGYIGYVGTNLYLAPNNGAGNVGIGTASPVSRTDIAGASVDQLAWGVLSVRSSDAQGADKGGSLAFGGLYDATNSTHWAQISGRKENGTSGQYGGYLAFATRTNGAGANTERARIDSSGVLTTTDLATYSLSGTTASVASGGTSAALFTPAASSEYIVYIQATSNTGVMAHAMVLQNGAASGALVSVVGSVLCTINNAAGALTITNNSGSAETFRWRALKLRSLV